MDIWEELKILRLFETIIDRLDFSFTTKNGKYYISDNDNTNNCWIIPKERIIKEKEIWIEKL